VNDLDEELCKMSSEKRQVERMVRHIDIHCLSQRHKVSTQKHQCKCVEKIFSTFFATYPKKFLLEFILSKIFESINFWPHLIFLVFLSIIHISCFSIFALQFIFFWGGAAPSSPRLLRQWSYLQLFQCYK
jgi:hypothetical protein